MKFDWWKPKGPVFLDYEHLVIPRKSGVIAYELFTEHPTLFSTFADIADESPIDRSLARFAALYGPLFTAPDHASTLEGKAVTDFGNKIRVSEHINAWREQAVLLRIAIDLEDLVRHKNVTAARFRIRQDPESSGGYSFFWSKHDQSLSPSRPNIHPISFADEKLSQMLHAGLSNASLSASTKCGLSIRGQLIDALWAQFSAACSGGFSHLKNPKSCANPKCAKWFIGQRISKRFCSDKCRVSVHEAGVR